MNAPQTVPQLGAGPAWHDPATSRPILTYDDQRARAESERAAHLEAAARAEAAEADLRRLREG